MEEWALATLRAYDLDGAAVPGDRAGRIVPTGRYRYLISYRAA